MNKQACSTAGIMASAAFMAASVIFLLLTKGLLVATAVMVVVAIFVYQYRRHVPLLSRYLGYGEIKDDR